MPTYQIRDGILVDNMVGDHSDSIHQARFRAESKVINITLDCQIEY